MKRKAGMVIKQHAPVARQVKRFKIEGYHCHRCQECERRYSDYCADPWMNARCRDCAGQMYGRSIVDGNAEPAECCRRPGALRPCTTAQRQAYRLAGETSWWICRTCCRTHPYQPSSSKESR